MAEHILECTQIINRPLAEVFEFFADAGNLERITPPDLIIVTKLSKIILSAKI